MIVCISRSAEETRALGRTMSQALRSGDVVSLTGPLGSGKTCLIQGLCQGLGVAAKVKSPGFVLWAELEGKLPVRHVDLYRLSGPVDLDGLGLEELCDGQGVTLVEWGEKAGDRLAYSWHIVLEQVEENERRIAVQLGDQDRERTLSAVLNDPGA